MFATCLFCHSALGANESLPHFPVGRRIAFDAAKGRLWVVCPKCERWNLSPLEERWEAIEEAEQGYRDTKKRVATDNIGLARLADGTELVRIGSPLRPEFAAWRYGDQFGRRRRRQLLYGAGALAVYGGIMVGGPALGLAVGSGVGAASNLFNVGNLVYQRFVPRVRVDDGKGSMLPVTGMDLRKVRFSVFGTSNTVQVEFPYRAWTPAGPLLSRFGVQRRPHVTETYMAYLEGDLAVRAMARMLPALNGSGGSAGDVRKAVAAVEAAASIQTLLRETAKAPPAFGYGHGSRMGTALGIQKPLRLALEMALHEDDERRALEGELQELEQRWKDAEEIAAIADSLTLDVGVEERIELLRKPRTE